jgi:hypothetical protein
VFTAVALVATAVGRRALMQNLANRRVVFVLFLGCCGVLTNRGVAWALDVPLGHMLVTDMLVASAVAVGAGITVDRAISVVGIAFLLGVLAGVLAPDAARPIFTLTQVLAFTLAAVVWVRRRRRLERPSET